MNEQTVKQAGLLLDDPWFAERVPDSEPPAPESVDPALETWFDRGRPLSSRPPPPDTES
jgi:hypothetical protein